MNCSQMVYGVREEVFLNKIGIFVEIGGYETQIKAYLGRNLPGIGDGNSIRIVVKYEHFPSTWDLCGQSTLVKDVQPNLHINLTKNFIQSARYESIIF